MGWWPLGVIPFLTVLIWTAIRWKEMTPHVSQDPVERCSLLLRIAARRQSTTKPFQDSYYLDPIPYLIEIGRYDPATVGQAIDRVGVRFDDDIQYYLEPVYWNVESGLVKVDTTGHTFTITAGMPSFRTGYWPPFHQNWEWHRQYHTRRDLGEFVAQRRTPEEIDAAIVRAFRDVPFRDGQWRFDESPEPSDFLSKLKRLMGLRP